MRIVVSGTHGSGKSTLIADFAALHPGYEVLGDPFEDLVQDAFDELSAPLFAAQLEVAAQRLLEEEAPDLIAERGPLDFVAYLTALDLLGRRGRSDAALRAGTRRAEETAHRIDLLALLPLSAATPIPVGEHEDEELRLAMNDALLDLAADAALAGAAVVEISGSPAQRLAQLEEAIVALS